MAFTAMTYFVFGETITAARINNFIDNDDYLKGRTDAYDAAWTAFTPSWTNLTVGNGTNLGWYKQIGKFIAMKTHFTMGSTSSMGTGPTFALPVTAANNGITDRRTIIGHIGFDDVSTGSFMGVLTLGSTTAAYPRYWTNAAPATHAPVASGDPMSWTTSDKLISNAFYEAA